MLTLAIPCTERQRYVIQSRGQDFRYNREVLCKPVNFEPKNTAKIPTGKY